MLKYSEACLLAGTWMLISGLSAAGWVFIALSMLTSFVRYSLEYQRLSQESKDKEEALKAVSDIVDGVGSQLGVILSGKGNGTLH